MAKRKDWDNIDYQLNKTGVMQAKLEAIISTKEELQAIRRKGGPKSRGITKESNTISSRQNYNISDNEINELKLSLQNNQRAGNSLVGI
jgi:hypothetical protein